MIPPSTALAAVDVIGRMRDLVDGFVLALPNVALGLAVLVVFVVIAWALGRLVRGVLERAGRPLGIRVVLGRLTSWGVGALGLLTAATIVFPSLDAAALLGGLGVTGVAIGFAFKDVLQNLLAGILILLTRPYEIGDQIVSGGHEGTVEDIRIRATFLRTYDARRVVIPNSDLYTNRVIVNTAFEKRRLQVVVGIGYEDDIAAAKRLAIAALGRVDGVEAEPAPTALVVELGPSTVDIAIRFWISPPARREAVETMDAVLIAVKTAFDAERVSMPFPTRQVILDRDSG